jgi:hypothetical protein
MHEDTKDEFSFNQFFSTLTTSKAIHFIVIIGILVFGNMLFNGFVWDDIYQIVNSPIVKNADYSYYFTHTIAPFYRPLMFVSYITIYQLFGLNAFFYHLFQLSLHIVNTIFVFILLKHFSKKIVLSFFLSLLFLIHPINAETVEYIANFQEVLFLFFGLLATILMCKKNHVKYRHVYIVTLLLFSVFSKETGLLFVLIYPLYYFIFEKTHFKKSVLFGGLVVISYFIARYLLVGAINISYYNIIPPNVILTATLSERLLTIPKIVASYITTLIFPTNLSIQYWIVKSVTFSDFILPLIIDVVFFCWINKMRIIFANKE